MNSDKIWLSSPHMGGGEQKYVQEAFDTNWIAPLGPNVSGFEQDLEKYLGGNHHVAALSSGTAALHLALIVLGVQAGDEVICQSMTFSASANPIVYLGATPIFVDSEAVTWNLCPIALEAAIVDRISLGKKPKAIIAVHLYGVPFNVAEIRKIAKIYQIPIIEDSAEALGSSYDNQKCGTLGDIGILSFNGNKIITTSGGGALVTKDPKIKEKVVFLATQARDNAPHYQHSEIGYNYRMSNVCAGIGRGQMEVLEDHVQARRAMHAFYLDIFKNIEGITVFQATSESYANYWLSAIIVDESKTNGITREQLRLLFEAENIETRPLWKPMHLQPVFANSPYYGAKTAESLFEKGLCLPSGSNLTDLERDRIQKVVDDLFRN
ncbi:MAG: pyridoxal phosphate-dependent aminotransferase [Flavobacterium sp.]|nr:MAG: pyridoxal phosphate-dependent aminotransferase [Flavobacterium sp.]